MKNNRLLKIATLVLSCLLLIGAVIGISVSADDSPAVSIKAKNISYEGAIKILYAVDADNVPEGAEVKMYFYTEKDGAVAYEKEANENDITINEETYNVFFSEGIAPKNMRAPLYAKAVIVANDGTVLAASAVEEYSIYTYAMNRYLKNPTSDQFLLYSAMLDYGSSVQKMLVESGKMTEKDVIDNGGWANAYCGINVATVVDGEVVATTEPKFFTPGEAVKLTAPYGYGDGVFKNITDENGGILTENGYAKGTVIAKTAGVVTCTVNYEITGFNVRTFDNFCIDGSADDVNVKYKGQTETTAQKNYDVYAGQGNFGNSASAADTAYQRVAADSTNANNNVYLVGANNKVGGNMLAFTLDHAYEGYEKYVMQYDLNYHGITSSTGGDLVFFRIEAKGISDANDHIIIYLNDNDPAKSTYTFGDVTFNKNEKYTFRFELVPQNNEMYDLYMYANGELVKTWANMTPVSAVSSSASIASSNVQFFYGMRFFNRVAKDYSYELDNVYVGVDGKPGNGNGLYADETLTYKYNDGTSVGNYVIHGIPDSAKIENNALTMNGFAQSLGIKNSGNATGAKYIYETDIKFSESAATKSGDDIGWWGLSADLRAKESTFASYTFRYSASNGKVDYYTINRNDGATDKIVNIYPEEWYNIRIEYTPTTQYQGFVEFYVNGVLITSYTANGYSNKGNITNAKLSCIGHEYRYSSSSGVSTLKVSYANTYLNAVSDNVTGTGVYYNNAELAGARFDGSTLPSYIANSSGTGNFTTGDYLTLKSGINGEASANFGIKNPNAVEGNVHVFEADIRLAKGISTKTNQEFGWCGLAGTETRNKNQEFLPLVMALTADENNVATGIKIQDHKAGGGAVLTTLEAGKWYNIRFVYTVTGEGTGTVQFFVNNELIKTYDTVGYNVSDSDVEPNNILSQLYFEIRGTGSSGASYVQINVDNMFFGSFTEE